ncbi:MAG TPA: carboxypeptidase regulatory-like domain-containing protein [Verrucomicrobiae bacterium]|nr:carboxypeptidase regulatory-like domain-containing protein [Verrucomicrobiae bacterium]
MIARLISICVLALLFVQGASAFVFSRTGNGSVRHWELVNLNPFVHTNVVNPATHAVRYFLASDGYSSTNTTAELNALRASFDQWQLVSGTTLKFEDAGLVAPGVDINTSDNRNVLFFAKSSTIVNGGTSDISGRLGVTFTSFFSDGTFAEADIVFNGVEAQWFTDFSSTNRTLNFMEGTALHEIGHFIGLAHSPIGGASMLWIGDKGVDTQAGLSADEIAAVRAAYPTAAQIASLGALKGTITKNGSPVLGAAVVLESAGNAVAGAVSRSTGAYEFSALPPGNYQVRVVPLDPNFSSGILVRGPDIGSEFNAADTTFLPTANTAVVVTAGATNTLDFALQNSSPAFRIGYIRAPTANAGAFSWSPYPTSLKPGATNITLGVASGNLPTSAASLTISGDGLTVGTPTFNPNAFGTGLNFISVVVSVATNATPGLRTLTVQQGANTAHANGYLEILPQNPDYDFDGLADTFQRQYFARFTLAEADPNADPDGDTFINSSEYRAGTSPTNSSSFLKIETVTTSISGATVVWRSVSGKRYQMYFKPVLTASTWSPVGSTITASSATAQQLDPAGASGMRFYRVEVLP